MKKLSWSCWSAWLLLLVLASCTQAPTPGQTNRASEPENAQLQAETVVHSGVFPRNSNLQEVLSGYGFSPQDLHRLIEDTKPVYNLHRVRAGNPFEYVTDVSGQFKGFRYEVDAEKYFRAFPLGDGFGGELIEYKLDTKSVEIAGVLAGSLWDTLLEMGEDGTLVVHLAEILQWDVDFTAIQPGDWFKLIVEKKYKHGEFLRYGQIQAVQFNSSGKDFFGFRFQPPGSTKVSYYDLKGQSLKKAFLKVPFHFSPRISSGFSYSRLHPILKKRRPHPALDFAAPYGTPVLASAAGRVVFAGVKGGFGKFVRIRHANGYRTSYAHLSRILVRAGSSVTQGQVIGKVGATGLATAAHLDYRIQDARGKYLNPRKRIAWPSDKAVDKQHWSEFTAVSERFLADLERITLQPPASSTATAGE